MLLVERNGPPIYARIEADLRRAIAAGAWPVGNRIPSEAELRRRYGVSRMTVRQALERLAVAGLLVKRQGVGTFVARDKIERVASRLLGFQEDAVAHGLRPATRVLTAGFERVGEEDALALGLDAQAEVFRVRRLRSADDEPIGLNTITVVPGFARELSGLDYAASFYAGVVRRLGVDVGEAAQTIEAVHGGEGCAELLQVAAHAPLLRVTRVTYLADGRLLGLTRSLYRGDRYYLSLALRRTEPVMHG
jgi:GntR family transcriptional regulator